MKESKIISTSDLYSRDTKKGLKKILTTKDDVPDDLPVLHEQPVKSKAILTSDAKENEDEK